MTMSVVILAGGFIFLLASCSDQSECHECHIAYQNANNIEIEYELGEYCESNLQDLETNGYELTEQQIQNWKSEDDDLQQEVMDEVDFELVHDKVMEDGDWPELTEE